VLDRAEVYKVERKKKHRIDYVIEKQVIAELQAVESIHIKPG